mmetsp:Transcript_31312/g.60500  ORF Transcript_31312/g.60500 Transcript_31312/m.60500 type:complete len:301 (+) Transcript_31312:64-966(+)
MKSAAFFAVATAINTTGMALRVTPANVQKANVSHQAMALHSVNTTQNATPDEKVKQQPSASDALSQAMSVFNTVSNDHARLSHVTTAETAAGQAATVRGPHAKLDVGFGDFEHNLTAMVDVQLKNFTANLALTAAVQKNLEEVVTRNLSTSIKDLSKPLKQSIGKTWVALPQDDQKDAYVGQLRSGFQSVFESCLDTCQRHLALGLHHLTLLHGWEKKLQGDALFSRIQTAIAESLIGEHCYQDGPKKAKKAALAQTNEAFCMQSVLGGMIHRLNDTSSLISMTMRFESNAMGLVQKEKK